MSSGVDGPRDGDSRLLMIPANILIGWLPWFAYNKSAFWDGGLGQIHHNVRSQAGRRVSWWACCHSIYRHKMAAVRCAILLARFWLDTMYMMHARICLYIHALDPSNVDLPQNSIRWRQCAAHWIYKKPLKTYDEQTEHACTLSVGSNQHGNIYKHDKWIRGRPRFSRKL